MKAGWLLVSTMLLTGLASPGPAAGTVTLKLAHTNNPGHPIHEAAAQFAESVQRRTNGEVQVKIFPSSQLGRMNEMWTGVKIGTIEIGGGTPAGTLADFVPELSLLDAPYMFRDVEHLHQITRG